MLDGLLLALSPLGLVSMFAGAVIGVIIGILPGLGPVFGVALLLPFTFWLPPHLGLVFLASLYSCCVYSGSIPAVLLGIPGTTGSITTVFDGHELAKQGKAGIGLGLAATSSVVGGLVGAVSLGALAPPLAELALTFSPADFFALAALGLSMVAVASKGDTAKGLVLGIVGILVSSVGVDRVTGDDRFTFGIDYLAGGVPFVPAVVGLFALSQAFVLAERGTVIADTGRVTGHVSEGIATTLKHPFVLMKNAILGVVLGVVPGVGINITNFTAYLLQKRSSRDPESFGKGNALGVIAPEAANSACVSAELIPAFALGIPGGATSAIFLAALNNYGLRPGYAFFSDAGPVAWALIAGLVFAQLVFFAAGIFGARWFARITLVPPAVLVPIIMALSFIGGIVDRSLFADVAIVLLFGIAGYVLQRSNFPIACLILGMILGPLMEDNFYRALIISQNDVGVFFESPISLTIWTVTLLVFVWGWLPISGRNRKKRENRGV